MVSEREIEAAKRYLPLATDETIRVALEAAARVREEAAAETLIDTVSEEVWNHDASQDNCNVIDKDGLTNAGEPVAWAYELANFYTKDRGYYDFELQISKVDPRKTWEIAPDRIRNIRPLYAHPAAPTAGGGE